MGDIEFLKDLLRIAPKREYQAMFLQSWISEHGAIPNEYGEEIKTLLKEDKTAN